jgi:hypothetical protein
VLAAFLHFPNEVPSERRECNFGQVRGDGLDDIVAQSFLNELELPLTMETSVLGWGVFPKAD